MPSAMSSSRPAALIRGAMPKPMSVADRHRVSRPATSANARSPAQPWPARNRRRPAATNARLFMSSGTRSATVPTATRSSKVERSGPASPPKRPSFAQAPAQRQQDIEDHADTGEHFARERVAGLVRIDDRVGRWNRRTGEVVVGDQDLPSARLRRGNACMARNAMIDRDQQVRLQRGQVIDQPGRQAIAMDHAIGHRVGHVRRTQHAQATHPHRARGRTVAIEIANDDDVSSCVDGRDEQFHRGGHAAERIRWQEVRQFRLCMVDAAGATHRMHAPQQVGNVRRPVADGAGFTAADGPDRHSSWASRRTKDGGFRQKRQCCEAEIRKAHAIEAIELQVRQSPVAHRIDGRSKPVVMRGRRGRRRAGRPAHRIEAARIAQATAKPRPSPTWRAHAAGCHRSTHGHGRSTRDAA